MVVDRATRRAAVCQDRIDARRACSILNAAWHMLQTGELYRDLGGDYFTRPNPDRLTKRLIRQLEALGHHVTLEPQQPQEVAA
jgi:hypothetical protein